MKIRDRRVFSSTQGVLWRIIRDPGNMPAWNPKCVECGSPGSIRQGAQFPVSYEMNGKRTKAEGEILNMEEPRRIEFRYHYSSSSGMGVVDESFELKQMSMHETEIIHTVDFSQSDLPWWIKRLIGFLGRFGWSKGRGSLDGLEDLI